MGDPPPAPAKEEEETPSRASSFAAAEAQNREVITGIRERMDLVAKTFGGLGTTLVTGIGVAKFSDVFPWPGGGWLALIGVVAGFIGMIAAVIFFAYRLSQATEPLTMQSDLRDLQVAQSEKEIIEEVFGQVARLNGASSLLALEARAHRLSRIANRLPDRKEALITEADDTMAAISATYARAAVLVARRRSAQALRGGHSLRMVILFAVSVLCFGIGADYLESERSAKVAAAKACAEAREAKAKAEELPRICAEPNEASSGGDDQAEGSARQETIKALAELVTKLNTCETQVNAAAGESEESCAPLRRAIRELAADV